jgi:MoxR-like ATPase
MKDWWIMRGDGEQRTDWTLPDPPSWRAFADRGEHDDRGASFLIDDDTLDVVNMALLLRRPLLVTGEPGTGKSTLAFAIAHELGLKPVLYWSINSRSTLHEGLYGYDAIGRLQETGIQQAARGEAATEEATARETAGEAAAPDIGAFITLGPLGTALLPSARPRVLLVDEIDKGDIDLPNDLLNIFEEGSYPIPELVRLATRQRDVEVGTADDGPAGGGRAVIVGGRVRCDAFPIVVLTSNGERDFPPAFLRRCVQLDLPQPNADKLGRIVTAHLGPEAKAKAADLVKQFLQHRERSVLATDQLLNAVYLLAAGSGARPSPDEVVAAVFRALGEPGA